MVTNGEKWATKLKLLELTLSRAARSVRTAINDEGKGQLLRIAMLQLPAVEGKGFGRCASMSDTCIN